MLSGIHHSTVFGSPGTEMSNAEIVAKSHRSGTRPVRMSRTTVFGHFATALSDGKRQTACGPDKIGHRSRKPQIGTASPSPISPIRRNLNPEPMKKNPFPTVFLTALLSWALTAGTLSAQPTGRQGASSYPPVPPSEREVGIAYGLWADRDLWSSTWDKPQIGEYDSRDRRVIRKHAEWLSDAGVDFVWLDWSNNVTYDPCKLWTGGKQDVIEDATAILFDEYRKMSEAGLPHPRISIFIGVTGAPRGRRGRSSPEKGRPSMGDVCRQSPLSGNDAAPRGQAAAGRVRRYALALAERHAGMGRRAFRGTLDDRIRQRTGAPGGPTTVSAGTVTGRGRTGASKPIPSATAGPSRCHMRGRATARKARRYQTTFRPRDRRDGATLREQSPGPAPSVPVSPWSSRGTNGLPASSPA